MPIKLPLTNMTSRLATVLGVLEILEAAIVG